MLPLQWLQPCLPSSQKSDPTRTGSEVILPYFDELQRKTWETLYSSPPAHPASAGHGVQSTSNFQDKSPKGSVDAPIQALVDLINHHSAICTLSSCSGRISLFDPNEQEQQQHIRVQESETILSNDILNDEADAATLAPFTEASGKGRGRWVVVSHEHLDPEIMVHAIFTKTTMDELQLAPNTILRPWTLKLEPMLLHIAARSLEAGQALLQLALECGFRESGLVVTPKRVTVAIRSHSLALGMPLLPQQQNYLCPTPEFIRAMVHECNQRLTLNWKHMERLYQAIEKKWFRLALQPQVRLVSSLPPLRLWTAATVAVLGENNDKTSFHTIYTFGGFGKGPGSSEATPSQRTCLIYQLQLPRTVQPHSSSSPTTAWEQVSIPSPTTTSCWKGLSNLTPLTALPVACQGLAAAPIADWVVLWGGRAGPTKPLDPATLYLFHPATHQLASLQLKDVCPAPRWGHSLVALSDNRLVLVGGGSCGHDGMDSSTTTASPLNALPVLEHVYLLHYKEGVGFLWEQLEDIKLQGGRMHAAVATVGTRKGSRNISQGEPAAPTTTTTSFDTVMVIGGLHASTTQSNPLLLFSESPPMHRDDSFVWSCHIGPTEYQRQEDGTLSLRTLAWMGPASSVPTVERSWFGASVSALFGGQLAVVAGGVTTTEQLREPLELHVVQDSGLTKIPLSWKPSTHDTTTTTAGSDLDFASLVHHSCVPLSDSEFALIGGGVSAFAFGDTFASSYRLQISLQATNDDENENKDSKDNKNNAKLRGTQNAAASSTSSSALPSHDDNNSSTNPVVWSKVVYVHPKDAKKVKTELQDLGWLDKNVRMTTVEHVVDALSESAETLPAGEMTTTTRSEPTTTTTLVVAIPITNDAYSTISSALPDDDTNKVWMSCILSMGKEQNMPLSTARFAASAKTKK